MFRVFIQRGAILAVVVLFWGKLWPFGLRQGRVISKPEYRLHRILRAAYYKKSHLRRFRLWCSISLPLRWTE